MLFYQRMRISQPNFPLCSVIRICFLLLVCPSIPTPVMAQKFTESGLMNIPTGAGLEHGKFGVGMHIGFQHASQLQHDVVVRNVRDEVGLRLNFGMFDRGEIGLSHLWYEPIQPTRTLLQRRGESLLFTHLKIQLLKEKESGLMPSVAFGFDNFEVGADTVIELKNRAVNDGAAFLVVSKTFNLPRIHLISGHIGFGTARFTFGDFPIGFFGGVSTEFHPAFARGDIALSIEFDGVGVNTAMRHTAASGFQTAVGIERVNTPKALRYSVSVSWTNERMMEQIAETKRLIVQSASQLESSR